MTNLTNNQESENKNEMPFYFYFLYRKNKNSDSNRDSPVLLSGVEIGRTTSGDNLNRNW